MWLRRFVLSAEADPEHGNLPFDGFPDQLDLGREMRVAIQLVDVHGAAQNDEPVVAADPGPGVGLPPEVHVADPEAVAAEQWIPGAQDLEGDVLEDE